MAAALGVEPSLRASKARRDAHPHRNKMGRRSGIEPVKAGFGDRPAPRARRTKLAESHGLEPSPIAQRTTFPTSLQHPLPGSLCWQRAMESNHHHVSSGPVFEAGRGPSSLPSMLAEAESSRTLKAAFAAPPGSSRMPSPVGLRFHNGGEKSVLIHMPARAPKA